MSDNKFERVFGKSSQTKIPAGDNSCLVSINNVCTEYNKDGSCKVREYGVRWTESCPVEVVALVAQKNLSNEQGQTEFKTKGE